MTFKIKDLNGFMSTVFGADDLLEYFPELNTTGVELIEEDGFYYIAKNGKPVSDSCFFSEEEMEYLEKVEV
ncbi:hypothetical protein XbC2_441 [Xanthomonas phage XbC2]|nr:hypothetical protein XbC2_441 [Xanthomonas phage XbC2]